MLIKCLFIKDILAKFTSNGTVAHGQISRLISELVETPFERTIAIEAHLRLEKLTQGSPL